MMTSFLLKNIKILWGVLFALVIFFNLGAYKSLIPYQHEDAAYFRYDGQVNLRHTTLLDQTNVPIPTDKSGNQMSLEERVRYLELKINAFMNFGTDPFFASKLQPSLCNQSTDLTEYGCKKGMDVTDDYVKIRCNGLFDHKICIDRLPKPGTKHRDLPCLVYDFGIREQPQFGATMARVFGCEVHGFDPSPVSTGWWESNDSKKLRDLPNYHFHPYGAGGTDGSVTLNEYDWGQVSILRYPSFVRDCTGKGTHCDLINQKSKSFQLPVKTLPTIIKELGHVGRTIDILKIDVEGSEYAFLENLLDSTAGCPDFINQITLEWHHYDFDSRYGEGSNPSMNAIATLLHSCGLKNFWQHSVGGWPSNMKIYHDLDMKDVRYNLASFYRQD